MEYHECRKCSNQYETHTKNDGNSIVMENYARYLGLCSLKCWDKIPPNEQNLELMHGWVYGDSRKRAKFKVA
jgi:hypothetical protein